MSPEPKEDEFNSFFERNFFWATFFSNWYNTQKQEGLKIRGWLTA